MINKTIFRAYDIRWIYEKDFDLKWANDIGKAYWTYMLRLYKAKTLNIVVWRDWRVHSEDVQASFIEWLISTWIKVTNIWLCPSPLLYFSICKWWFDWWVNITASHNPKEYNWFKLQKKNSESVFWDQIEVIYWLIETKDFIESKDIQEEVYETYFPEYLKKLSSISWWALQSKNKVVLDAWNWVAWIFASNVFKFLGYEVIELYCNIDWNFPNHPADPEDESTLKDLQEKVVKEKADIWFAFDWDWDRVWMVDNNWEIYNADKLMILFARDLLSRNKGASIIYELNITSLLAEEVEKLWWKAIMCKTWHSYVEHMMKTEKALLGWENSGHLFFAENYYWFDDACLAAVLCSKILLKDNNIEIKDHFKDLPETLVFGQKFEVKEDNKFDLIEDIITALEKKYTVNKLDWARIEFPERAWCVIRASNTSPKVQIRIESRDPEQLEDLKNEMTWVIKLCIAKQKEK